MFKVFKLLHYLTDFFCITLLTFLTDVILLLMRSLGLISSPTPSSEFTLLNDVFCVSFSVALEDPNIDGLARSDRYDPKSLRPLFVLVLPSVSGLFSAF